MSEGVRRPWVAGLSSAFLPGLGQFCNGETRKALIAFSMFAVTCVVGVAAALVIPYRPWSFVVPVLLVLSVVAYFVVDAVTTAARMRALGTTGRSGAAFVFMLAAALGGVTIVALGEWAVREFCVEGFTIPTGSMEPTIVPGDRVLADKLSHRFRPLERRAVIMFREPWEHVLMVARVIGLPGERVEVDEKGPVIDGRPLEEPESFGGSSFGPVRVPRRGDLVEIRSDRRLYVNGEPAPVPPGRFRASRFGKSLTGFEVFYGPLFPEGTTLDEPEGPWMVEEDWYFLMGDNRDSSRDSRFWGFVPHSLVVGTVTEITWSVDERRDEVRWERIGRPVR